MAAESAHGDVLFHTSSSDIASGKWVAVQKRVFTRWANAYLKPKKVKIEDVTTDLGDGIILIRLLEALTKQDFPKKFKAEPKMRIHKLENLKSVFEWMRELDVKMVNVGASDVADGNEKIILALLFALIVHFMVGEISLDGVSGKEGLLLWCQRQTADYDNVEITNFNKSWSDGLAFCALIHKHRPEVIPYEELSADDPARNLAIAFAAAEDYFAIDRILDVEDITEAVKPDEKIVLTYVAFFFKGFANHLRRQGFAKSIAKAVGITQRHDEWIEQYNAGSAEMAEWLAATTERYANRAHGSTSSEVKGVVEAFYAYKDGEKPEWKGKWANLEGLYQTFAASARNNGRPVYIPAAGLSVSELQASWAALEESENAYEEDVRSTYDRFLVLENLLGKFDIKLAKLDAWMDAQNEVFASQSYGTSLTTVETLIDAFEAYQTQLASFREVAGVLYGWLQEERMEEHALTAERVESYNAAMEKLEAMDAAGVEYQAQLELSRERFEKFAALDKVDTWMDGQLEMFAAQQYGESLAEVRRLIEESATYELAAAPRRAVLDGMTSEQEVITARVAEEQEKMASTDEQAGYYKQYLELSQEKFEKFLILDKLESWCQAQSAVFAEEDYGDTLSSVATLLENVLVFRSNLAKHKEVVDTMESHQEEIIARLEEARTLVAETSEEGEQYHQELLLCQERLQKLPVLDKVEAWAEPYRAKFSAGELGETLAEVRAKLGAHAEYQRELLPFQAVVTGMTTEQPSIQMRLEATQTLLDAVAHAGEEYNAELVLLEERLVKNPQLDAIEEACAAPNELFSAADYGETVAAAERLLEAFELTKANIESNRARVASITSEQEVLVARIAEVTKLTNETAEAGAKYEQGVKWSLERHEKLPMLQAIDDWCASYNAVFAAGDYGDTVPAVDTLLDNYAQFSGVVGSKRAVVAAVTSEQSVITERAAEVLGVVDAATAAGDEYKTQLELSRERHVKLPQLQRVEDWCQEYRSTFAAAVYGDSVAETDSLLEGHGVFNGIVPSKKAVVDGMSSEQEIITNRIAEVSAIVEAALSEGAAYKAQLELCRERHVKLPKLQRVEDWCQGHRGVFAEAEYGETIAAVDSLLETHGLFTGLVPGKKAVVDGMSSEQDAISNRIDEVSGIVEAAISEGAAYKSQLDLNRERLVKLPQLERVENWCQGHRGVFAAAEYGDSVAAADALLASHTLFTANVGERQRLAESLGSEQEAISSRQEEVLAVVAAAVSEAAEYEQQVKWSRERHVKLPKLDEVERWTEPQRARFASGEHGDTLDAVNTLLENHAQFDAMVSGRRETVANMTSEQDAINSRKAEVSALLDSTASEADAYNAQLVLSKERLEKLPQLDKIEAWCNNQRALFAAANHGDTVAAVTALLDQFENFGMNVEPKKAALAEMTSEQAVIMDRRSEVQGTMEATETEAAEYHHQLLLSQERLEKLPILDAVETWQDRQLHFFRQGDYGDSLTAVATLTDAHEGGYQMQLPGKKLKVDSMESEQEIITGRISEVQTKMTQVEEAAAEYVAKLEESRASWQHIVDLIKSYNSAATALVFDIDDLDEELNEPVLTNSVQSVQLSIDKFNDESKAQMDRITEAYNQADGWARELIDIGSEEAFERYTLTDLYERYVATFNRMAAREEELAAVLDEEQGKEALRLEFAEVANAVVEYTEKQGKACGNLSGSLEEQAAALQAMQEEYEASDALAGVEAAAAKVAEAGIITNPHTRETLFSVRALWEVLKNTFNRAEESIQAQLLAARDEQVTPEQYKEIKEVFEYFDQDEDHALDRKEFHSCATGIGVVLTDEEVTEKMAELDTTGDGMINFKEFTSFMIQRLVEPGHTLEDVRKAFEDLAEGEEYITPTMMKITFMDDSVRSYLEENMGPTEVADPIEPGSYDYAAFVAWLFSR